MVEIVGSVLSSTIAAPKSGGAVGRVAQVDASQRFSSTLKAAAEGTKPVGQATSSEVQKIADLDAKERARRALQLDANAPAPSIQGGDTILNGLQKLRSVFDKQQARVNGAMSGSMNDLTTLLNVQMEVVNYSLLVDVTSKLTGKSTQTLETLLKG